MKKISVIIPIYNVEEYLEECIESVLKQTYQNLEIILINDASTDGSGEICQKYAENNCNIIYIPLEENRGVVHARGCGLKKATGEYIGFVDADDWIEPEMYAKLIEAIQGVDLSMCGANRHETNGEYSKIWCGFFEGIYAGEEYKRLLSRSMYDFENNKLHNITSFIWDKLFKKKIIELVYQEIDEDIAFGEDMILLYKYMLKSNSIHIINEVCYNYRQRSGSAYNKVNDNILLYIHKVYHALKTDFMNYEKNCEMSIQLQKWVGFKCCRAINASMGFDAIVRIPEFFLENIDILRDKKIVLYGAGKAGKDCYWQLSKRGIDIVAWLDKNYVAYKDVRFGIMPPNYLYEINFDVVLITVQNEEIVLEIKKHLLDMGIAEEKILWKKFLVIYEVL